MRSSVNMTTAQLKPMRAQRWVITPHAVERYIRRVRPSLTPHKAWRELSMQCLGAHFVKRLDSGIELWRGPKPHRIRLRVMRRGPYLELVTVLFAFDR